MLSRRIRSRGALLAGLAAMCLLLSSCRLPAPENDRRIVVTPSATPEVVDTPTPEARQVQAPVTIVPAPPYRAEHYVAPGGSPNGDGTIEHPWDLQTALNQPHSVLPGDVIWLRGGAYTGTFMGRLNGTESSPIYVRGYPGERATIDKAAVNNDKHPLDVRGTHTWYMDFEVTNADPHREEDDSTKIRRGNGVTVTGPNNKFINLVVHDVACGFGFWKESESSEIYGSIIYNNGWMGPDGGNCHGIYMDNVTGTKRVVDNIIFSNFSSGIHAYSETDPLVGLHVEGNVSAFNGMPAGTPRSNIIIGGLKPSARISVIDNHAYYPVDTTQGYNFVLGLEADDDKDFTARGNYISGGFQAFKMEEPESFSVTGNTIIGSKFYLGVFNGHDVETGSRTWDRNHYVYTGDVSYQFRYEDENLGFPEWRAASGFDANGTYSTQLPAAPQLFVRPSRYEEGRANIIVWNWPNAGSVSADLSGVLAEGAQFEVRNAFDFYSPPVLSGTYTGGAVRLPLNDLRIAAPTGWPSAGPSTSQGFAAFVVITTRVPTAAAMTPVIPGMPRVGTGRETP